MMTRRNFLKWSLSLTGAISLGAGCQSQGQKIRVTFKPSPAKRGHELWKNEWKMDAWEQVKTGVLIVGGGVSGLSAAYHLQQNGFNDFMLCELDEVAGGNSVSGANAYSAYPYGAHYLTLPNADNGPLIDFLHRQNVITGFDENKRPHYNEKDLCFDPEERLFIRGTFQDGLVPLMGLSGEERLEINRFFKLMQSFSEKKGEDGKYFFNVPVSNCSNDTTLDHLDKIAYSEFLKENNFSSVYLLWYLDYCCRDDFGASASRVSAWAGINYFAARRANPANTNASRVLTWPEGNARLVKQLAASVASRLHTGILIRKVSHAKEGMRIEALDYTRGVGMLIDCKALVMATPLFVTSSVLDSSISFPFSRVKEMRHTPWMVAAITLSAVPGSRGQDLSWDNVAYQARSLGYIFNQHQQLSLKKNKTVISLYLPLDHISDEKARREAHQKSGEDWKEIILRELERMHHGITAHVEEIEICLWGHGMVLPGPGLAKSEWLSKLQEPLEKIYFAHSDLAAYSCFEEAFDQGYRAAMQILNKRA